jgi:hypothetical protein
VRGTVMAEYVVVLFMVSLGAAAAMVAVAPRLAALLRVQLIVLAAPGLY